jgi:hypothetical protein
VHRMTKFIHFHGIDPAHAGVANMDDGEECVRHRHRGSRADADMHLVDKRRTLVARILTGNHSHARRLDGAGLGLTETGRDFRQRSLHRVGHPVGQVRRREGAGKEMAWNADRAILP